jgi:hypothetical protein
VRLRISGRDLENLKYIMGYDVSVPKAIAQANRQWKNPLPAARIAEIEAFMTKFWKRLGGE